MPIFLAGRRSATASLAQMQACDLNVAIDLRGLRQIPAPPAEKSCAATSSANALIGVNGSHTALPLSNPHSAWGTTACHFPRFRSLKAFGRRPRCKPHRRDRPASETLNKVRPQLANDGCPFIPQQQTLIKAMA
jgi:hypothetical protein